MTSISVIFEIPADIAEGLANGTLERVGGVIRKAENKQVKAWLTEAGEVIREENSSVPPSILNSSQMLMGLQVANLAVNVAGFALIYHKLQRVEHQLANMDQKLDRITVNQEFLDHKHLISKLSPVIASLRTLASIHHISDRSIIQGKLITADDKFGDATVYFKEVLGHMLANKLEQERPEEFMACYRAWVMASQGHVQTMLELDENREALARAETLKIEHQNFGREFIEIRRNPLRKLINEHSHPQAEALLKTLGQQSAGVHELVKGRVLQLEHMVEAGLRLSDLPHMSGSGQAGYALLRFD